MPWIIGGAMIGGGLIGASGQRDANSANAQIAKENRDWQERMSNTAYQRAARDLDQAGLNRILAFGSPATTPAGNVAHMENAKKQVGEAVSNTAMMAAQIRQINAQTALTQAQTNAIKPVSRIGEGVGSGIEQIKGNVGNAAKTYWSALKGQAWRAPVQATSAKQKPLKITDVPSNMTVKEATSEYYDRYEKQYGKPPTAQQIREFAEEYAKVTGKKYLEGMLDEKGNLK